MSAVRPASRPTVVVGVKMMRLATNTRHNAQSPPPLSSLRLECYTQTNADRPWSIYGR